MNLGDVIVFGLIARAIAFFVLVERNSRQNEAKLKAEAAVQARAFPPPGPSPEPKAKGQKLKKSA